MPIQGDMGQDVMTSQYKTLIQAQVTVIPSPNPLLTSTAAGYVLQIDQKGKGLKSGQDIMNDQAPCFFFHPFFSSSFSQKEGT